MAETELFLEGVNLMYTGMGFVLVFLLILILALRLMSTIVNRFFPDPIPQLAKTPHIQQPSQSDDLARLRPVIIAAIEHYRRSKKLH